MNREEYKCPEDCICPDCLGIEDYYVEKRALEGPSLDEWPSLWELNTGSCQFADLIGCDECTKPECKFGKKETKQKGEK